MSFFVSIIIRSKLYESVKNYCDSKTDACGGTKRTLDDCWYYDPDKYSSKVAFLNTFPIFTFYIGREVEAYFNYDAQNYLYESNKQTN